MLTRKPRVLITDNVNQTAVDILSPICDIVYEKKLSADELKEKIVDVDALMIRSASTVTPDVLDAARHLQIVGRAGVGTDNIDLPAATQRGVIVVNSPDGNTVAASEHTIGMIFALARLIPEGHAGMKQGQWNRSQLMGVELFAKTLGVIGMGRIGQRVAKTCIALGMKVLVFDPFLTQKLADEMGIQLGSLEDIWAKADFITIHAPKTKETANLLNEKTLSQCKPGVRIVNCARGGIINEADLAKALESGKVAGVALDVFDQEPIAAENPLLALLKDPAYARRIVLTPHLGASTEEAQVNVAIDVAEQIRDFFQFGYAKSAVNIPMLRQDILDPVKPYMPLAEVIGSFVRQLASGVIQTVNIQAKGVFLGDPQLRIEPLKLAVLKGMLSHTREGVNYVNALGVAEERGIEVTETKASKAGNYLNLLEVQVTTLKDNEKKTCRVAATLIAEKLFRIVYVDGYHMTLEPTANIVLAPHHDKPGMIAGVASVFGAAGVNISSLQVARRSQEAGGESLMVFNLDSPPSEEVLAEIQKVPGVYGAKYIALPQPQAAQGQVASGSGEKTMAGAS
ncbi:MAG: phosphoglycerate dehydrogenase [Vampirovibrionales bacterium]|nr:phosphoglycerate dehydrogenase [Vampirovibrionales bacterium]